MSENYLEILRTYVVQHIKVTVRGINLPTISTILLFGYIRTEHYATVLQIFSSKPFPFAELENSIPLDMPTQGPQK